MAKKRIFSGIQPSGNLHIGNYLGAIKNWVALQDEYDSIFCVVDLHAITVPQNPEELSRKTIEIAKICLAAGIDPEKSAIFIQSHIPEHPELTWILNTITRMSDLFRMTQFKDKTGLDFEKFKGYIKKHADLVALESGLMDYPMTDEKEFEEIFSLIAEPLNKVGVGLFDYPALMAADILLYDTQVVPVGEDQVQHIELTRTLAKRFNSKFGETFVIPEPYVRKEGMRIMGLDNPTKKMSKSAPSEYNYISLTDDENAVNKKIKKAVTDSGSEIIYSDGKPALKNLINIYSLFTNKSVKEIEKIYVNKGYAEFKKDLAEVINGFLVLFQRKMADLSDKVVLDILKKGAEKVRPLAQKKLEEVKKEMGFLA